MEAPKLIETNITGYLHHSLKSCHNNRVKIYSYVLNIGILLIFICIVGVTLYYCYRRKPTAEEQRQKMLRDQEYVLSKIRFYQGEQQKISSSPIH